MRRRWLAICCSLALLFGVQIVGTRAAVGMAGEPVKQATWTGGGFLVGIEGATGRVSSIRRDGDVHPTDYLMEGKALGDVVLRYRVDGGSWRDARTDASADIRTVRRDDSSVSTIYDGVSADPAGLRDLGLTVSFQLRGDGLLWTLRLRNRSDRPLVVGDLALPITFAQNYEWDPDVTYNRRVLRHSLVSGDNSWAYWERPTGSGPYLVMTPLPGTHLEYYRSLAGSWFGDGTWLPFIHAQARATETDRGGTWRQPVSSLTLAPAGRKGDTATYGFRFQWAKDTDGVRDVLVREGLLDVIVAPGMTVPRDLDANIAIRTRQPVRAVTAEYPDRTEIERRPSRRKDTHVFRVRFRHLGENRLTVEYGNGRHAYLEFFSTLPLETMIRKRAAFLAAHQVRNPGVWYDGLFPQWDMEARIARTPDNPGPVPYFAACGSDDPGLCMAPYLAAKNLRYPDPQEIRAIEYYLDRFSWGKQQRTDTETPHPYGIYGSDSWRDNRNSKYGLGSGGLGQERMWRTFDYTHMIQLYVNMYRIARRYPEMVHYLDAKGYLRRALGTAQAYFSVPYNIKMGEPWSFHGWTDWAYKQGNFDEVFLLPLIDALRAEGMQREADWVQGEWEKKVKYMVLDNPFPYGSEMKFDTTAFESTHAAAKWALEHPLQPDFNLWYDKNLLKWYSHPTIPAGAERAFMDRQMEGNIAARGWVETAYYLLGTDLPQGGNTSMMLRYMTTLGGWPVLDYGLRYAKDPYPYLRLGYASLLSSWALMNAGDADSGFGYWFPGPENDGAAGWAFDTEKGTRGDVIQNPGGRGAWRVDGEVDNGYSGYIRYAATVVADDPVFGPICYGGNMSVQNSEWDVRPADGIGQRFHMMNVEPHLHVELDRDGMRRVRASVDGKRVTRLRLTLENATGIAHTTHLAVEGLTPGDYVARVSGGKVDGTNDSATKESAFRVGADGQADVTLDLPAKPFADIELRRAEVSETP